MAAEQHGNATPQAHSQEQLQAMLSSYSLEKNKKVAEVQAELELLSSRKDPAQKEQQ